MDKQGERNQKISGFSIFAEELRCPADHEPGDEDGDDAIDEAFKKPTPLPPNTHCSIMPMKIAIPPSGVKLSCIARRCRW